MIQTMKWALPLCLLIAAIPAGAQTASVAGYTTLEYDAQTNTMIGTCTMNPSYTTEAYYTPFSACGIMVTGGDTFQAVGVSQSILSLGADPSSFNSTVEYTPSAGVSYTAVGGYNLFWVSVMIDYIYFRDYSAEGWDPWDYSYYEEDPEDCLTNGCTWPGAWTPTIYLTADEIAVGSTSSNPVTAYNPTYAEVLGDTLINMYPSGNILRQTTYEVYNADGTVAAGILVGENFSATGWSCTASQPETDTTSCSDPVENDLFTGYTDFWEDYGGGYSGPGGSDCGTNVVDHWQWCESSPPKTFMTLKGWIHTASSNINGWINPPNEIPTGEIFVP